VAAVDHPTSRWKILKHLTGTSVATTQIAQLLDSQLLGAAMRVEYFPRWIGMMPGVDESLFKTREEMEESAKSAEEISAMSNLAQNIMRIGNVRI
jgi:hypothetical protein